MPRRLLLLPVVALALSGCTGGGSSGSDDVAVVAALYPLAFLVERVGGDRVSVQNLTTPGVEPHDLELTAQQAARIVESDLAVHLEGLQPAVDEAVEGLGDRRFDVAAVEPLTGGFTELGGEAEGPGLDPHVWLDPVRMQRLVAATADRLAAVDPDGEQSFRANAAALTSELAELDEDFRTGLARCARKEVVTSHNAFGYLTRRYGLMQVGISGLSPEAEPSPRRVAEAAAFAKRNGVTTIFFEELVSPAVAETVAREVGATTAVLSTLEGAPEAGDYLTAMRGNLEALTEALDCDEVTRSR